MSYQHYQSFQEVPQPTPEAIREPAPQVRVRDTMYSVTSRDGDVTEATQSNDSGTVGELNRSLHGADAILATARHPQGLPVYDIEPTTLVEVNGVQAPVSFWVQQGVLQRRPDGTYASATDRPQEAPVQADMSDYHPVGDEGMAAINGALEIIPEHALDSLAGIGVGIASGRLEMGKLAEKYADISGIDRGESSAKVGVIVAQYQKQADAAITNRFGVGAGDLPGFYRWAKQNMPGQLGEAVQKQMRLHDVSGYREIAQRWLSVTAPSDTSLKSAGIPTRTLDGTHQVFTRGQWMSSKAAARAGLL